MVALGREDVCLEPKLLMSAYDKLLLDKAKTATIELLASRELDSTLRPVVKAIFDLFPLVEAGSYTTIITNLAGLSQLLDEVRPPSRHPK